MKTYTKASLIEALKEIHQRGWIENTTRVGNQGAIGNLLEDLLELEENNLPLPNAAEWELKAGRNGSRALTTLMHVEPSPIAIRFVPAILLPQYGWTHIEAGSKYLQSERSFRQTIRAGQYSDRGFSVVLDHVLQKVMISFDARQVSAKHHAWLKGIEQTVGLGELNPQPYWGFQDLTQRAGTKLPNLFYVTADRRRVNGREEFHYMQALMLTTFDPTKFIAALQDGQIYIDFDARTSHNHGTKFRIRKSLLPYLYTHAVQIF
ncbi:MAG: MvaI/BcnI family restriction endonuclease [Phototrophicaceae bacterium]